MSKLGIDVSSYNGAINWKKVKDAGYKFACIKIIRKDLNKDTAFERNWNGCKEAGLDIYGVYNYSYATNIWKAKEDAEAVLKALGSRKTIVWLDVEDKCQKGLKKGLIDVILLYKEIIEKSGNRFGVYTGQSFYNSYISPYSEYLKGVKFWIARYGVNNGQKNAKYQPKLANMVVWQYTSKGQVDGIVGNVDLNVSYDDNWIMGKAVATAPSSTPETAKNPYTEPTRLLRYVVPNMRGNDVKWLQYELVRHGYLLEFNSKKKSNIDGVLGKDTRDSILQYQKAVGIEVDGVVGRETRTYLKK